MKSKIERLSRGEIEYELPQLVLSPEQIRETLEAGKIFKGSFTVSNQEGRGMSGKIYSSSRLLTLQCNTFEGTQNCISYEVNAQFLKAGEEISGTISIITDCGEVILPFTFLIEAQYFRTSLGKVRDLFQFTNLARSDWAEAKKVFRQEAFEKVLLSNDEKSKNIYRQLLRSSTGSQAMEEFLIAIHKKSKIQFHIEKTSYEYKAADEMIKDKIIITKDQWGYAQIKISSDAPFIQLEQKLLWADQFIGNEYKIAFQILPGHLGKGRNYGKIRISTIHQKFEIEVVCHYLPEKKDHGANGGSQEIFLSAITRNYLDFRLNRSNLKQYMEKTQTLLNGNSCPDQNLVDVMKTHIAIISGNEFVAAQYLEDFKEKEAKLRTKSSLSYATFLYLNALYHKEDGIIKAAADKIRGIYENEDSDWRILWLLLYLDKRYDKNPAAKLAAIREQFERGCHSPILYYEAVCVLNEEPMLLRELNRFEMQAVYFGMKHWILCKEAAQQFVYLANKQKGFHPMIYQSLVKLYDEYETVEILTTICSMLIKGLKRSHQYFEWYQRGAQAQLRITELYEYYMYALDDNRREPLAQSVLFYFIYNSNLNDHKKAVLYANIIRHKDNNESIYHSYYKRIELFAMKQLEAHHISSDLAVLYREMVDPSTAASNLALHLPYVIYQHEIICAHPDITEVRVIHPELNAVEIKQLVNGSAYINIPTGNTEIFLSDSNGNCYYNTIAYELKPLFPADVYEEICENNSDHPLLILHLYDRYHYNRTLNDQAIRLRKKVLTLKGISERTRMECLITLIDYYYENYDEVLLEDYLLQADLKILNSSDRNKVVEYIVIRMLYQKAFQTLEGYGFEGIAINRLLKLCSGYIIMQEEDLREEFLTDLCHYIFRHGKFDEAILTYLLRNFNGTTGEMYQLWQSAVGFELDTHALEERLITQMLFAECYVQDSYQVFCQYYKKVTNHQLVRAFLTYYGYKYLVCDRVIHPELFLIMKRELNYEENEVCLLAWLKKHTNAAQLSVSETDYIEYHIERLASKGIVLPFFLDYKGKVKLPAHLKNKYYLEYITDPRKKVSIHYRLNNDPGEEEFITETMPNLWMGIHVKEFVLFYHEILQYYITETMGEEVNITKSTLVQYEMEDTEDESRYHQINLMLAALEMGDDTTLLDMMEHYVMLEYAKTRCFQSIDQ